jgi:hypothetical protein
VFHINNFSFCGTALAISVLITTSTSGAPVTLGQSNYFLTCIANGTDKLDPTITYRWTKNSGTNVEEITVGDSETQSLTFYDPLRLSDAGQYICQVNVSSPFLNQNIIVEGTLDIRLESELQ